MDKFEYRCPICGTFRSPSRADYDICPQCGSFARRVWGFAFSTPFRDHFSPSTGTHITSRSAFQSELDRASDAMSERGIPSNYQPVDWMDKEALGVTNEGLDSTYNALKSQGKDAEAKRLKAAMDDS